MARYHQMTDHELRTLNVCPGCLRPKEQGTVVCWDCFKHHGPFPGLVPLKYSGLSIQAWIRQAELDREAQVDGDGVAVELSLMAQ